MAEATLNPQIEEILKALVIALQPQKTQTYAMVEQDEHENLISDVAVKAYKEFQDYPDVLRARHIRAILDISEAKAYEVLNSDKCPSFTIGKCKRVRKEKFIEYLIENEGHDLIN